MNSLKDLEGSIKKVAAFLQRDLTTEDVQRIAKHCSFDEMKKNPAVNHQWMNDRKLRDLKGAEFLRHGKSTLSSVCEVLTISVHQIIGVGTVSWKAIRH